MHDNRNRVCGIDLHLIISEIRNLFLVMQEPFPALTHIDVEYRELDEYEFGLHGPIPAIPDGFLGGSAPQLQSLKLDSIPFPALPKLLLSTTSLVYLRLSNIPESGNISPKELVTGLAASPKLKSFIMEFEPPHFLPNQGRQSRAVLPSLTRFQFKGKSEYLEVLVAMIDAPLLDTICITFSNESTINIPEFARFMRRTPRFQVLNEAHVEFGYYDSIVKSLPLTQNFNRFDEIENSGLIITCREINWSLLGLARVFTSLFPSIYIVEHLYVYRCGLSLSPDIEDMQWLEIFRPLTAVKKLYICEKIAQCIAPALQQLVGESATDVLPVLENLFLEGLQPSDPAQEAIGEFVAARQLLGHTVAVSHWDGMKR
jgi:hypothetical protein